MTNYYPFITKCKDCGKEFLLEIIQDKPFNNILDAYVTCKECIAKKGISPEFAKANPKETSFFTSWLAGDISIPDKKEAQPDVNQEPIDKKPIIDLRNVKPRNQEKKKRKR